MAGTMPKKVGGTKRNAAVPTAFPKSVENKS